MQTEQLIKIVSDLLEANKITFDYAIYDALKMDNVVIDVNKINGIARITGGSFDPIEDLGQSIVAMTVEFIHPYERLQEVKEVFTNVARASAGLVIINSTLETGLLGITGVDISYPTQGNYGNGTMGETIKSTLVCYFDINEKSVLANQVKLYIQSGVVYNVATVTSLTVGTYYTRSGTSPDYVYTAVILPAGYVSGTTYYSQVAVWERIPYYKFVITRHRLSTTNKFKNDKELLTINDGQSIDFSLAVPSITDSVLNGIKDDMLSGANLQKVFNLKFIDEKGEVFFNNMFPSGDFSYEIVPGANLIFKILFVYKRV